MNKKKILFVTESHKLASGFGTYAKEVIPRLHKTGKYEIAQMACYSPPTVFEETDWLIYGIAPKGSENEYHELHQANPVVQWGLSRFEQVCLDFKPDIVATYRDPWMDAYIADSPFLPLFHWVWMPTVDSEPQKNEWLYMFNRCDGLIGYSEYGKRVLEKQTKGRLKVNTIASPGIDHTIFNILPNKEEHKVKFGLPKDSIVIGTVMRNQKRKMFPELMKAFKRFLEETSENIKERSILYLHTSHPEKHGWDITSLIHEYGLGSKVITTYKCKACGEYFVSKYRDAITVCNKCGNHSAVLPSVSSGIEHSELVNIYNLMDLYVQYSICEGFGMPQVEAAACGVPIASINYSAMEDVVKNVKGYPIQPILERELETNADRSKSNQEELIKILKKFTSLNKDEVKRKRLETRRGCIERYTWDNTAKAWEKYFDSVEPKGLEGQWDTGPFMKPIPKEAPANLSNKAFCEWIFREFVQDEYHLYNYRMLLGQRNLNFSVNNDIGKIEHYDKNAMMEEYKQIAERRFYYDAIRTKRIQNTPQSFILEAHRRVKK